MKQPSPSHAHRCVQSCHSNLKITTSPALPLPPQPFFQLLLSCLDKADHPHGAHCQGTGQGELANSFYCCDNKKKIWNFIFNKAKSLSSNMNILKSFLHLFMCVCTCAHHPTRKAYMGGGQGTSCGSQFSLSIIWAPGTKLRSSVLTR